MLLYLKNVINKMSFLFKLAGPRLDLYDFTRGRCIINLQTFRTYKNFTLNSSSLDCKIDALSQLVMKIWKQENIRLQLAICPFWQGFWKFWSGTKIHTRGSKVELQGASYRNRVCVCLCIGDGETERQRWKKVREK